MKNKFIATLSDDCQSVIVNGEDKAIAEAYQQNFGAFSAIAENDLSCVANAIVSKDIKEGYFDFCNYFIHQVNLDHLTGKYNAKISVKNTRFGKGKVTCLKSGNFEDKDDENEK